MGAVQAQTPGGVAAFPGNDETDLAAPSRRIIPFADELRRAQSIQRALLPRAVPSLRDWTIAASCTSAGPIGGDFYDVFTLPSGSTMLLVADVMGKGIPAALIASVARTVTRMAVQKATGPAETFARVNEMLYEDLSTADMFITAQSAWIDAESQTLRVSSAGHCPMLVRDMSGALQRICAGGIPIGVAPRAAYSEAAIPLESISCAMMYTDGVTETRNRKGAVFGMDRLENWFGEASLGVAETVKEDLLRTLEEFQGGTDSSDDQTVVVLARRAV